MVFDHWVDLENENLTRVRTALPTYRMPATYMTNGLPTGEMTLGYRNFPEKVMVKNVADRIKEALFYLTMQLENQDDFEGAVRAALLCRHLFRDPNDSIDNPVLSVSTELERRFDIWRMNPPLGGIDELGKRVDALLARRGPTGSVGDAS